jgi:LPXTG-motif cell wall-anchored protein
MAALVLLAGALLFAPIASTQSGFPTLSPTPPVTLAPAPITPVVTTTTRARPVLPKTGFEAGFAVLLGLGLVAAGTAVRRVGGGGPSRRSR